MNPIGLTLRNDGELMIVHRCLSCGKIAPNRIAGDDMPEAVLSLLNNQPDTQDYLTGEDVFVVRDALYGKREW